MAINATQRSLALDLLLRMYGNDSAVANTLPGVTSSQILTALLNAIGSQFDTQLKAVCDNHVSTINAQITSLQGQATPWTVT